MIHSIMRIGIPIGDVTGIGPEVALKAVAAESKNDDARYVFIGDETKIRRLNEELPNPLPLAAPRDSNSHRASHPQSAAGNRRPPRRFSIANPLQNKLPAKLPAGSTLAAKAAMAALREGAQRCLRGELAALVTAPVNKEAIIRAGFKDFVGQTEFLSELAGTKRTVMMLLGHDERGRWLRVALATTHVALKSVPGKLTAAKVALAIELANQACRDLRLGRARIAVAGLNPHAGEGGEFGDEEIKLISPVVSAMRKRGHDVTGPISGDTVFYYALRGDFDAVVAMFHDQGLAPLKAVAFDTGVNWTLGLPFIRTSPDHGTAYDIAGKWTANPSSMVAAIQLAKQLAARKGNR